jgi:hypothetical protein
LAVARARGERGQVLPLVAVLVVVAALAIVVIGRLGAVAVARARARTAADAVALAGAAEGRDSAARVAADNDAIIIGWLDETDGVTVVVVVDRETASARAVRGPPPCARPAAGHLVDSPSCPPNNPG